MAKDGFNVNAYASNLVLENPNNSIKQKFALGEAMISQKQMGRHESDLKRVKEIVAEL